VPTKKNPDQARFIHADEDGQPRFQTGIRDNHTRGTVANFLNEKIQDTSPAFFFSRKPRCSDGMLSVPKNRF